eukprot:jgi/Orpsp1_1/1188088/evm.model.d7180000062376.1
MFGSLCYSICDWIIIYGDPTSLSDKAYILTKGTAQIGGWCYVTSMVLAYPCTILSLIGICAYEKYIPNKKHKTIYHWLNFISFTTWLAFHLSFVINLYAFQFMMKNGYQDAAVPVSEAIYSHFSWITIASEILILPSFLYLLYLIVTGRTTLSRKMSLVHSIPIIVVLFIIDAFLPKSGFKNSFTNAITNIG